MTDESWRKLYPFTSHWRCLDAGRYHYLDEGPRGDGEAGRDEGQGSDTAHRSPLLMVHGNPTWSFYWRRLVQEFATRHRVVVPDHLGCGLSDKPQDYRYRLQDHIDNLVGLIDELDLRDITLLGHDWGGAIGLGAALARRDRFSRLVLLNTGAFPPSYIPWRIRVCRTPLIGRWAVQGLNLFSAAAMRMAVNDPGVLSVDVRAGLLAPYDRWANRIAVYRFVQDIPASPRHPTWKTLEEIESGLSTFNELPVQLIWGMRDWCFRPSCLDRFARHLPAARVCRIPRSGHWVVEEAHDEVADCLHKFFEQTEVAR